MNKWNDDPLDRDKFPNRPDHPDFWELSKVLLANDASVNEDHKTIPEAIGDIINTESLEYHALNRTGTVMQQMHLVPRPWLQPLLAATWLDAFAAGARYMQREKPGDNVRALIGKQVRVYIDDKREVAVVGKLLGWGQAGDFEILEDDGFVHYCWPLLTIEEVPE